MRWLILILAMFVASPSVAGNSQVRDGGALDVGGVTYRLGGIDVPAPDQVCIDDHADSWGCGAEARDQLAKLIGDHDVHCEDLGPDTTYKNWHLGTCTAEGQTTSLNQLLVQRGFATNIASASQSRFGADETDAKTKISSTYYEIACKDSLGYVVITDTKKPAPDFVDCLEADQPQNVR